jgi:hypothetical protein
MTTDRRGFLATLLAVPAAIALALRPRPSGPKYNVQTLKDGTPIRHPEIPCAADHGPCMGYHWGDPDLFVDGRWMPIKEWSAKHGWGARHGA